MDPSSIQKYYTGCNVFITGVTGFLGHLIFEKILRTCSHINKVYILVREKNGHGVEKRLEEILDNALFDVIKNEQPEFINKIVLIKGDCALPDLGIKESDKHELIDKVNCVFHVAATLRFNEKLKSAINTNVRATKDLVTMAKNMKHLKSFIYVSTAYSNCVRDDINEEFYEPPMTATQLLTLSDTVSDELLEKVTPILLGSWPNTYAYTKAVAEDVIRSCGHGLPIAVVRPSIVHSTLNSPVPGWVNSLYGVPGILFGVAMGVIRTFHCDMDVVVDVIPADIVINTIIAAAWEVGSAFEHGNTQDLGYRLKLNGVTNVNNSDSGKHPDKSNIRIYNCGSSTQNPITYGVIMGYARAHSKNISPDMVLPNYLFITTPNDFIYSVYEFLLHTFPAYVADIISKCFGKKPRAVKIYTKVRNMMEVMAYFTHKEWQFSNANSQALCAKLDDTDRKLFNCDVTDMDWKEYISETLKGARLYLIEGRLDRS